MAHSSAPADADPREIQRARDQWHNFTNVVRKSIIAIIAVLVLLAWITL
jgi:hypothetical protein